MTLASAQRVLWDALGGEPQPQSAISQVFAGAPDLPAAERVAIYSRMVLYRQVDALREDFPCVATLCGDDAFFALSRAYLARHPSRHPSLSRLGAALPSFLRTQEAGESSFVAARPDLADLAALEWARCEVFDEEDQAPEQVSSLARLEPERFALARVRLVPALRPLGLAFDAALVFAAIQGTAESTGAPPHDANGAHPSLARGSGPRGSVPAPTQARSAVVVWRQDGQIFHAKVADDELEALQLAARGAPLGEICGAFAARPDPVGSAFAALRSWFADGWIAALE